MIYRIGGLPMSFFWTIWEILVNIIESLLFTYLLRRQLGFTEKRKIYIPIGFCTLVCLNCILNFSAFLNHYSIILMLFADILYAFFLFQGSITLRFFWGLSASCIASIANDLIFFFATVFTHKSLEPILSHTQIRFQMTLLYLLLSALIYFFVAHIKSNDIFLPWYFRLTLLLLLLIGIFCSDQLITLSIFSKEEGLSKNITFSLQCISILYLGILLTLIIFFEQFGKNLRKNFDLSAQLQQANLEKIYYQNIQDTITALRSWKHDCHHHIQTMQILFDNGKLQELRAYLNQFHQNFVDSTLMFATGHPALDAILTSKILIAKTNQIATKNEIFLSTQIQIPQTDLCTLLGNLLENAIDACIQHRADQKPYIHLIMKTQNKMLYVKIANTSNGHYNFHKKQLATTKTQPGHGYGCKRITKIVKQYGGFCLFEPKEDSFTATVALPL